MYSLMFTGISTLYPTNSCKVEVTIRKQEGVLEKVIDTVSFTIPKPYDGITEALDWECRKFLNQNGYPDITYSTEPPEGVLPEQTSPEPI